MGRFLRRISIIVAWVILFSIAFYFPRGKIFSTEEKSINVFAWGNILSPKVLSQFERDTGIKVHLSYYGSNEELQVKMIATGGKGYDLIMPSDYTATILIEKELLKPLDPSKFKFWDKLSPFLLNLSYDPGNRYSIPFEWEVYGLGIDSTFFKNRPFVPSWRAVYDKEIVNYRIAAQNDPIEAVALAAFYLFGSTQNITPEKFAAIKTLLFQQRNWVEAYSDSRAPYFIATGNCPVAMTTSSYIRKVVSSHPEIDFFVPKEGSFISIENFSLSKESEKEELVYTFLNYLYSEASMKAHFHELGLIPAYQLSLKDLSVYPYEKRLFEMTSEEFKKLQFFKNLVPQQQVRDLWVEMKSF